MEFNVTKKVIKVYNNKIQSKQVRPTHMRFANKTHHISFLKKKDHDRDPPWVRVWCMSLVGYGAWAAGLRERGSSTQSVHLLNSPGSAQDNLRPEAKILNEAFFIF